MELFKIDIENDHFYVITKVLENDILFLNTDVSSPIPPTIHIPHCFESG